MLMGAAARRSHVFCFMSGAHGVARRWGVFLLRFLRHRVQVAFFSCFAVYGGMCATSSSTAKQCRAFFTITLSLSISFFLIECWYTNQTVFVLRDGVVCWCRGAEPAGSRRSLACLFLLCRPAHSVGHRLVGRKIGLPYIYRLFLRFMRENPRLL